MKNLQNRREFLKGSAWMGAAAVVAGCMGERLKLTGGGSMAGFAVKPMPRIRVAMVGLGGRGYWALRCLVLNVSAKGHLKAWL